MGRKGVSKRKMPVTRTAAVPGGVIIGTMPSQLNKTETQPTKMVDTSKPVAAKKPRKTTDRNQKGRKG
jgi:hypothetical protein